MKDTCILTPQVGGKDSKLYRDLILEGKIDRPVVNYLYSNYLVSDLADKMDAANLKRDSNGEHLYSDLLSFLHYSRWRDSVTNINNLAVRAGAYISSTHPVPKDFDNAKDALDVANAINNDIAYDGLSAVVFKHSNIYNVIVAPKSSKTYKQKADVEERLRAWDSVRNFFLNARTPTYPTGIDIDAVVTQHPQLAQTINAYSTDIAGSLNNLSRVYARHMGFQDALRLLALNQDATKVKDLLTSSGGPFATLEDAATALPDLIRKKATYTITPTEQNALNKLTDAIDDSRTFLSSLRSSPTIGGTPTNLAGLQLDINNETQNLYNASIEKTISDKLDQLDNDYNINVEEMHLKKQEMSKLSEVAGNAVFVIKREIERIKSEISENAAASAAAKQRRRDLTVILNRLTKELASKRYYAGLISFLNDAATEINEIPTIINTPPTSTGTTALDLAYDQARQLRQIKRIFDKYYSILKALADDNIVIDESISSVDIATLRSSAESLQQIFDDNLKSIKEMQDTCAKNLLICLVGDKAEDGITISQLLDSDPNASVMDLLYSIGESSHPIVAAMGRIIERAQERRKRRFDAMALRIRRATDKLYNNKKYKHKDTKFIYEDELYKKYGGIVGSSARDSRYIISDIDWKAYYKAKARHRRHLIAMGLKGLDLMEAMEDWKDNNTEDRVVNIKDGRTERVPNKSYRNSYATWDAATCTMKFKSGLLTPAQEEYYNTMMQIKGEIGSLFPEKAQYHYRPPQRRRSMLDAMAEANELFKRGKVSSAAKGYWVAIKNKWKDLTTFREDDPSIAKNGIIIDGEEYKETAGDFDNTELKEIPIHYINYIKEKDELLKDFSAGIQMLASVGYNYEAMKSVQDAVEFLGDFTTAPDMKPKEDEKEAEQTMWNRILIVRDLFKSKGNVNTSMLVNGFIDQFIYGQKLNPKQFGFKYAKLVQSQISYTSFKGLSTNFVGAVANRLVGEWQMLVEAGAGEFYGLGDLRWAHDKLYRAAGGEMCELLSNNIRHKSVLLTAFFDPKKDDFSDKSHVRYHSGIFRKIADLDMSMLGYSMGEFFLSQVNMYAILHHEKVLLNGKQVCLYDAFTTTPVKDGNAELTLKSGVTDLKGNALTVDYFNKIRGKIRYVQKTTHGGMSEEQKGIIHQYMLGRAVMNFRQWMVGHYSRRFRLKHLDADLINEDGTMETREGYYITLWDVLAHTKRETDTRYEDSAAELWNEKHKMKAIRMCLKDMLMFMFRAGTLYNSKQLTDKQRANINRVTTETWMFLFLIAASFALGEPDEHKRNFWRRFAILQSKRLMFEYKAGTPFGIWGTLGTLINSPMACVNTINAWIYLISGLWNGDLFEEYQKGPHAGENKYLRKVKKYALPFYKDIEKLERLDTDESMFKVLDDDGLANY